MITSLARHARTRREVMIGAAALSAWAHVPKAARAEGRDPRFLAIVLRGALDGLAAVAPVGDPDWIRLRGDKALRLDGPKPGLPLDATFALNPAMPNLHRLYRAKQATVVHAAATPYRERSHIDGQAVLESGCAGPRRTDTGWLNRAFAALEPERRVGVRPAFAVGPVPPLIVRGSAPVLSWTPLPPAGDMARRPLDLATVPAPERAFGAIRAHFAESAGAAGRLLARPEGPRIGALAFDGWDSHAEQGATGGRLANLLGALDGALAAVESGTGDAWRETVVAVVTEFGRTARMNDADGTDHGTATVALLAGGALRGGRVIADWPGVGDGRLYQGRDLAPTTDLRAVLKGLLRDHLRVDTRALARVFPDSGAAKPVEGLVL